MTTRRRIRIDVELPELTPAQADFLWNFLDDLGSDLWDAYESELLEVEAERSRPPDVHDDWIEADYEELPAGPDAPAQATCPFRSLHGDGSCPTCSHHEPDPEF